MVFDDGPVIAGPDVRPCEWAAAFPPQRAALVLAPASGAGWFGGLELVACDPEIRELPATFPACPYGSTPHIDEAGRLLDAALASRRAVVAAALVRYEGGAVLARFPRGLVNTPEGWRAWGEWDGIELPTPAADADIRPRTPLALDVSTNLDEPAFRAAVETLRDRMRAGDLYVANLTRRLTARASLAPAAVFAALAARSHAPMAASWIRPRRAVLSASPERFLRLEHGLVRTEPIKGTRPRGADGMADLAAIRELRACAKERAEHVMVVDLERNDLGRVCEAGTVVVGGLMRVETLGYCHQLVSTVAGLLGTVGCARLLAAAFPCGSVTGAPKLSAMERIAELEATPRREYCGSLLVAIPGRLDSSVLIRTAIQEGERLEYGVGCGITVDSDAGEEWAESVTKAAPLTGR